MVIVRFAVGEMFGSGGFKHRRETRCKQTVKCQPEMVYGRRKKRRGNVYKMELNNGVGGVVILWSVAVKVSSG